MQSLHIYKCKTEVKAKASLIRCFTRIFSQFCFFFCFFILCFIFFFFSSSVPFLFYTITHHKCFVWVDDSIYPKYRNIYICICLCVCVVSFCFGSFFKKAVNFQIYHHSVGFGILCENMLWVNIYKGRQIDGNLYKCLLSILCGHGQLNDHHFVIRHVHFFCLFHLVTNEWKVNRKGFDYCCWLSCQIFRLFTIQFIFMNSESDTEYMCLDDGNRFMFTTVETRLSSKFGWTLIFIVGLETCS